MSYFAYKITRELVVLIKLKIKGNSRSSKANSLQAPMHWIREITKAKLSQAETI